MRVTRRMVLAMRHVGVVALIALLLAAGILAREARPPQVQQVQAAGPIGTGWQQYDLIVSPGDWDGAANGAPDIIARKAADGTLWLFSGDGAGGYKSPKQIASGFGVYTQLIAAGKFTGDSRPDLMAVRNDGELVLFANRGHGILGNPVPIASGWGRYDAVVGAYNFSGFHRPDLIVRNASDGSLTVFAGNGHGGFSGSSLITSTSFKQYSLLSSPGDWDNDGFPDLMGRTADGTLCLFRGNGRDGLQNTSCDAIGGGWGVFDAILTPGRWSGTDRVDLLARTPDGSLFLATGAGISGYADPLSIPQCSPVTLHVSSRSPTYTINFERFGQAQPQTMATLTEIDGKVQAIPPNASRDGANWSPSATYPDTCSWPSGLYAARLDTTAPVSTAGATLSYTAYVTFVVRPLTPPSTRQLLVVASTNTWAAYNDWPLNGSFYSAGRPTQVSYLRPDPSASPLFEGSHLAGGEVVILQWLAAHNYAYQMVSDVDLNDSPWLLSTANYYAVVLSTHSEYWTGGMYDAVAKYMQDGGSVLSLSGNTMYHTEKLVTPARATWSSTLIGGQVPIRSKYAVGNLLGLAFHYTTKDTCAPYHVLLPNSWLMAGVKAHTIGTAGEYWERGCFNNTTGAGAGASGDEVDYRLPFLLNRAYEVVAEGNNVDAGRSDIVWYLRRDGGQAVSVGSISFGNSLAIDPNLSQIVINAIADFQRFKDTGQTSFGGLVAAGDWLGNGHPDLLARKGDSMNLFESNGAGGLLAPRVIGTGWAQYNLVAPAGNWTDPTRPDLLARRASDGALFVVPNDGHGGFKPRYQIGAGVNWAGYDTITGVGDWNRDGIPDLIARTPSGSIYLYHGLKNGQVDPNPELLATGWDVYDQIIPVDWNRDGLPDLIARKPDGSMWISLQRPDHSLAPPTEMAGMYGWDQYSTIVGGGVWTTANHQDLLARKEDGSLWLIDGKGATSFGGATYIGAGWNDFT
ncbi:MAG TPA: VCBS repeat-containing protein [Candidatus Micrarchaeaceae archaeon]|nr:VCBS repeat-containing protein [Candidatus Micrarchaeaceae archaeon]